jgi:hypothetical protein
MAGYLGFWMGILMEWGKEGTGNTQFQYSNSRLDAVRWGRVLIDMISHVARLLAKPARQFLHLGKPQDRTGSPTRPYLTHLKNAIAEFYPRSPKTYRSIGLFKLRQNRQDRSPQSQFLVT